MRRAVGCIVLGFIVLALVGRLVVYPMYERFTHSTAARILQSGPTDYKEDVKATPVVKRTYKIEGRLVFSKAHDLWLATGDQIRPLTNDKRSTQPAFSPDGQRIAYVQVDKNWSNLVVANADGSNPRTITNNRARAVEDDLWVFAPAWAPNGQQIVVLSDRAKFNRGVIDLALWALPLGAGRPQQLTTPNAYTGGDADPAWHPSGNAIIYAKYYYDNDQTHTFARLVLCDVKTRKEVELTPEGERYFQPAWAPDGAVLAYAKGRNDAIEIQVAPLETDQNGPRLGSGRTIVSGMVAQPTWSPDGGKLAFLRLDKGSFDIWVVEVNPSDGSHGQPVQITQGAFVDADSRLTWAR